MGKVKVNGRREIEQQLTPKNVIDKVFGKRVLNILILYLLEKSETNKEEIKELLINSLPFRLQNALFAQIDDEKERKLRDKFLAIIEEFTIQLHNLTKRECKNCKKCHFNSFCPERKE